MNPNSCYHTGKPCRNYMFSSADIIEYYFDGHNMQSTIEHVTRFCDLNKKNSCNFVENTILCYVRSSRMWDKFFKGEI